MASDPSGIELLSNPMHILCLASRLDGMVAVDIPDSANSCFTGHASSDQHTGQGGACAAMGAYTGETGMGRDGEHEFVPEVRPHCPRRGHVRPVERDDPGGSSSVKHVPVRGPKRDEGGKGFGGDMPGISTMHSR